MTSNQQQFEEIYQQAIYVVIWQDEEIIFRIGENNSHINQILNELKAVSFAFITAHNPFSIELSQTENQARQNDLIKLLQVERLKFLKGFGTNEEKTWEKEESLFILNISKEKSLKIGELFNQNAILFGEVGGEIELAWCV